MEKAITIRVDHELEQIQDADVRHFLAYVCQHLGEGNRGRKPSRAIKLCEDLGNFVHFARAVYYHTNKLCAVMKVVGFDRDAILAASFLRNLKESAAVDILAVCMKYTVDTVAGKRAVKQVMERVMWDGCDGTHELAGLEPWEMIIHVATHLVAPRQLFSIPESSAGCIPKLKTAA